MMLVSMSASFSSCTTTPAGTEVESEEKVEAVAQEPKAVAKRDLQRPEAARVDNPVQQLRYAKKVKGGAIVFSVDADPKTIAKTMLDFGKPTARRSWTKETTLLKRVGNTIEAHWKFEGKAGIYPACDLIFERTETELGGVLLRFKQRKRVFAMAAFFGDYRIEPKDGKSEVTMRVFLDSGLWIANVTDDEIAEALQADGALLQSQLKEILEQ